MEQRHILHLLPGSFAVCQLDAAAPLPPPPEQAALWALVLTADETSLVCAADLVPEGCRVEPEWRGFKLQGPFAFEVVGVLAALSHCLAEAGVSVFAVSTFDTDYLLVKEARLPAAVEAFANAGHEVQVS